MSSEIEVLFANETFYAAFTGRDLETMDRIWSRDAFVSCIHPGWNTLRGRAEVMASWRAILSDPQSPGVVVSHAAARVHGDVAYALCYEHLSGAILAATNIFIREDGWWRLVHHQAGASPPPGEPDENPATVQ